MFFEDARWKNKKMLRTENVEKVKEWLKKNKGGSKKDCSVDLGMSYSTICSIARELKNGEDK